MAYAACVELGDCADLGDLGFGGGTRILVGGVHEICLIVEGISF